MSYLHSLQPTTVKQACDRVWAAIQSGAAERDPSLLHPLALLSYCDLKHFKFRYWFGFPALQPPEPFTATSPPASLAASLGAEAAAAVAASCSAHVVGAGAGVPAWLVSMNGASGAVTTAPLTDWHRLQQEQAAGGGSRDVSGGSDSAIAGPTMYLAVADSSNQAAHPGWPLRNLLLLAAARCAGGRARGGYLRSLRSALLPAFLELKLVLLRLTAWCAHSSPRTPATPAAAGGSAASCACCACGSDTAATAPLPAWCWRWRCRPCRLPSCLRRWAGGNPMRGAGWE